MNNFIKANLKNTWFYILLLSLIALGLFSLKPILDIDIGFHLRGGEYIVKNLSFHSTDKFTYTVSQNEYIALHWLYQAAIYLIYSISNYSILSLVNSIIIILIYLFALYLMFKSGADLWIIALNFFFLIFITEFRMIFRPEIITILFILVYIYLLENFLKDKKEKLLYILPILMVVWVNSHGLFIIGIFIIACYAISEYFHKSKNSKSLFKTLGVTIVASLINPYFIKGALFPFYLYTRMDDSNVFKNLLGELKSPLLIGITGEPNFPFLNSLLFFSYVILSICLVLFTIRKRKVYEILIFAAFLILSLTAIRNIPIFIIYASLLNCKILCGIVQSNSKNKKFTKLANSFAIKNSAYIFIIFLLVIICRLFTNAYYADSNRADYIGAGLNYSSIPEKTANYLKENNLNIRMVNDMVSGSWFVWNPQYPVFIDGRLEVMQEKLAGEYMHSFRKGGLNALLNKYNAGMLVFNYAAVNPWLSQAIELKNWQLKYFDNLCAVYLKSNGDDSSLVSFDKYINVSIDSVRAENILLRNYSTGLGYWMSELYTYQDYNKILGLTNLALFAFMNGNYAAAENLYLQSLEIPNKNTVEIFLFLGTVYAKMNNYRNELICYNKLKEFGAATPQIETRIYELNKQIK